MSAILYLEGGASGADSKELQIRCREGFRRLLEHCGYKKRMPRLSAFGSRSCRLQDRTRRESSSRLRGCVD